MRVIFRSDQHEICGYHINVKTDAQTIDILKVSRRTIMNSYRKFQSLTPLPTPSLCMSEG